MKFTKEIKDKWLAALRPGKYKQGRYKLKGLSFEGGCEYCKE